ncbi:MAG: molybdate ABC transporter permease subunit [Phycisphaerales bacterium]
MSIDPDHPFWLSLRIAGASTALCFVVGAPIAYWLARTRQRFSVIIEMVILLPLVLPPTVVGYALVMTLGREGPIGSVLAPLGIEFLFSPVGAIVAAFTVSLPLAVLPFKAAFEAVAREYEELAALEGLSRARSALQITLPIARRGIGAGLLLAFARSLGEFGATLMVAGNIPGRTQTLSLAVYHAWQVGADAAATGPILILTAVAIAVVALQRGLLRPE